MAPRWNLEQDNGEDPIAYTLRIMAETTSNANELSADFGLAERRLDRLTEYMNGSGRWDSVDFCEFVGAELRASGREIRDDDV
ncbi:MAG: hypothetical protein QOF13_724 [Solirubrobacterales bacterium]|nr:hypothetical protein [Solirubrobacterales bacterium]